MTKGVKEVRGAWRDPRAEETDPPRSASPAVARPESGRAPAQPGRPSVDDLMRELALDLPPPPELPGGSPRPITAPPAPGATPSAPPSRIKDPFHIVGTTQAETFHVEKVVAHGGFGVIYKARHVRFRAPVALKCLKIPMNLTADERNLFFERFRAEGEVMFRLSSSIPEVVRPMHVDALRLPDGRFVPFIALEWLEGETLKDVIVKRISARKRPLPLQRCVTVLSPVARALARAHRFPGPDGPLAILHCDLKPDNLFVSRTDGGDTFKIFDFGIAKVRSAATRVAGGATSADASSSMFTPAYAAPEQWAPDKWGQTGPWTDVFALALTLTELATQKPAIDGPPAAMLSQCMDPARRPTPKRLGLDVPPIIDAIFARALAVDPKQRTQTIETFWGDLERALDLPVVVGAGARASIPSFSPMLPQAWAEEEGDEPMARTDGPDRPPSSPPPRAVASPSNAPSFGPAPGLGSQGLPSLDLDLPMPPAPPAPPRAAAVSATVPSAGIDLQSRPPPAAPPPVAQAAVADPGQIPLESFDLAAEPARPEPRRSGSGLTEASSGPPDLSFLGPPPPQEHAGPDARERFQAAAAKAAVHAQRAANVAAGAAVVGAVAAASAAKSLAKKAIEVDRTQVIRLDQPATWIRPMRGPLIAMGAAIGITIVAIIVNNVTGAGFRVGFVSAPLLLAAIGFAVYRWLRLQQGEGGGS